LRDGFIVFLLRLFEFALFIGEALGPELLDLRFDPFEFVFFERFGEVSRGFAEDDDVRVLYEPSIY
jgi:hypothetical protein